MEGEMRLKFLITFTGNKEICTKSRTKVFYHHGSYKSVFLILRKVRIKNFCITNSNCAAWIYIVSRDGDMRNTDYILTHIIDVRSGAFLGFSKGLFYIQFFYNRGFFVVADYEAKVIHSWLMYNRFFPVLRFCVVSSCPAFIFLSSLFIISFTIVMGF